MAVDLYINGAPAANTEVEVALNSTVNISNNASPTAQQTVEIDSYPERFDPADDSASPVQPDFAENYGSFTLQPDLTLKAVQSGSYPALPFKPDLPGRYVIRLTDDDPTPNVETCVVWVRGAMNDTEPPAAGENAETGSHRGWSRNMNRQMEMVEDRKGWTYAYNGSGGNIAAGKVVHISDAPDWRTLDGNTVPSGSATARERMPSVTITDGTNSSHTGKKQGIARAAINNTKRGWIQSEGLYEGDFTGYAVGQAVYVDASGDFTTTPTGVRIGYVLVAGATGAMQVGESSQGVDGSGTVDQVTVWADGDSITGDAGFKYLNSDVAEKRVVIDSQPTKPSASGAHWDALSVDGTLNFTGNTGITAVGLARLKAPTIAGDTAGLVVADAATLKIDGAPIAGANTTITNPWALWVDGGASRFDGYLDVPLGSAAAPAIVFGGVTDTGLFSTFLQDYVQITLGGSEAARFYGAGNLRLWDGVLTGPGAEDDPTHTFSADSDTGAWNPSADVYAISTDGTERLRLDASGNVIISAGTIADAATDGFLRLSMTTAGAPTGAAADGSVVVGANDILYFRSGGAWHALDPAGGGGTIDGSGAANQIAFWSDSDTLSGSDDFLWRDGAAQKRLDISAGPTKTASAGAFWDVLGIVSTLNLEGTTTVDEADLVNIKQSTVSGDTATVTVTDAAGLRVHAPVAGANVVLNRSYSIWASGDGRIEGDLDVTSIVEANRVRANSGNEANPSYGFQASTNSGLWRVSSTEVGMSAAGSEAMRWHSGGNVIISAGTIADAATDGFLHLSVTTSGAPSGTPTFGDGAIVVGADDKLHFYRNSSWHSLDPAGGGIDGSGVANRIMVWQDPDTATSVAGLDWDGTYMNAANFQAVGGVIAGGLVRGATFDADNNGTTSNPAFGWTTSGNDGMRRDSAGDLRFVTGGSDRLQLDGSNLVVLTGGVRTPDGTTSDVAYGFSGTDGDDDGFMRQANNVMYWVANGAVKVAVDTTGVGVGTTNVLANFHAKDATNNAEVARFEGIQTDETITADKFALMTFYNGTNRSAYFQWGQDDITEGDAYTFSLILDEAQRFSLQGSIEVTGSITVSTMVGPSASVECGSDFNPDTTNTWRLGSSSLQWDECWAGLFDTADIHMGKQNSQGDLWLREGKDGLYIYNAKTKTAHRVLTEAIPLSQYPPYPRQPGKGREFPKHMPKEIRI